ncbi:MAG: carbohydrate binding domain-containing protein [Bryobacterales bacterium]|nr:carbohydrate binding domain-containing protein [Bryobacterales bacterium]
MPSSYPTAVDSASTLYSPVDAFSMAPLETTTTQTVLVGDTSISVTSTAGFAASYGVLSINDELVIYTSKTASQFTGCQRGAFGTTAVQHNSPATVRANMVAGFIIALQSAVVAIETELGTVAARNYVRKDGAVTITGLKTFQDGAEFGSGNQAATGLVRLPNTGAVKWRKADNSGDLGMALSASDHIAMDAIIDFAPGQTFGAFSYPDATTTSKGIVQVDPTGGLAVAAGVLSVASSGVTPGTYTKLAVDAKGRATGGTSLSAADLPAHTHVAGDIVSGALPFAIQNNGSVVGTRRALNLIQGANMALSFADDSGNDRVTVTVALGSLPAHSHAESDVTNLVSDLAVRPVKGIGWTASRAAVINSSGELSAAVGNATDCVLQDGSTAAKANASHTHAQSDITNLVTDLAGKAASVHTHTSSQISDATAAATASTVVLRDGSAGANFGYVAANNLWAYLESHLQSVDCGAFQTVGGAFENMAKFSEDFSVGIWDKNGGSCSVTANSVTAPDGNATADTVTASTSTPVLQQQIAGLVPGGQYTFYVWAKVPSGTKQVSIAIVDNAYAGYLAGPTSITLTTSWQRFKITGTLAGGQTGLWIVVRQFAGNGDNWTSGDVYLWGACLQQGNDPKKGYARTWGYQASPVAAGVACGQMLVVAKDSSESPLRVAGPGSNLADYTLLQVTAGGELIIAGGTGNGYRLAELMGASNPSGWSGVIKVKNPAGVTAGYILLYSNP